MGLLSNAAPPLTEKNLPDQAGKVFIVTGSSGGVGKELAQILYTKNAKVYMAARSADKSQEAIAEIKNHAPQSKGELIFLKLDLADLTTIKASAQEFLSKEQKLDVLWNNAGVMMTPQGSKTVQGYEMQLGTNCVGPLLFTKLLTPILTQTAKTAPPASVRVLWVSSSAATYLSPTGGVTMDNLDYKVDANPRKKYGLSKAGNFLHGAEFAKRHGKDGILSLSLDPGNLKTPLYQHIPAWQRWVANFGLHEPIYGAYTELFAGLSRELRVEDAGRFIEPWGKLSMTRKDVHDSAKSKEEGGTGVGAEFYEWTEQQIAQYL